MRAARPSLDEEIAAGQFGGVMDWLPTMCTASAARLPAGTIKQATVKPLGPRLPTCRLPGSEIFSNSLS